MNPSVLRCLDFFWPQGHLRGHLYVGVPAPRTQNVTRFGDGVFADVVGLDGVSLASGGSLIMCDWCPYERGKCGRTHGEDAVHR